MVKLEKKGGVDGTLYVPYVGATSDVDLGSYELTTSKINLGSGLALTAGKNNADTLLDFQANYNSGDNAFRMQFHETGTYDAPLNGGYIQYNSDSNYLEFGGIDGVGVDQPGFYILRENGKAYFLGDAQFQGEIDIWNSLQIGRYTDATSFTIAGDTNLANCARINIWEQANLGAFMRYDGDTNKFYIGTNPSAADIDAIEIARGSTEVNFLGSISVYNAITAGGDVDADNYILNDWQLGTPTYNSITDWSNVVQSAGIISGGDITDAGSGNIDVSALTGIIKTTNSPIGVNKFFDLGAQSAIALTDNSINYVAADYNSGTPQIIVSTSNPANGHTIFNLGKVYRESTTLDIINSGLNIYDIAKRAQQRTKETYGFQFVSGAIVGEIGTRQITVTAGVMYAGNNRITTDAVDTSDGDTFEYYYYNGTAWVESDETTISNQQYNDITTGLVDLSNNKYGVHWVYKGTNGNTYVLYGQGNYTLAGAQNAQPPGSIPSHVEEMGVLRAKIIIEEDGVAFTEIESVADTVFTKSSVSNHNELAGLQGGQADQYYHLTAAEDGGDFSGKDLIADEIISVNSGTVNRTSGVITSVAITGGRTLTPTYTNGLITSLTDGTRTWTFSYTDGVITSWSVS